MCAPWRDWQRSAEPDLATATATITDQPCVLRVQPPPPINPVYEGFNHHHRSTLFIVCLLSVFIEDLTIKEPNTTPLTAGFLKGSYTCRWGGYPNNNPRWGSPNHHGRTVCWNHHGRTACPGDFYNSQHIMHAPFTSSIGSPHPCPCPSVPPPPNPPSSNSPPPGRPTHLDVGHPREGCNVPGLHLLHRLTHKVVEHKELSDLRGVRGCGGAGGQVRVEGLVRQQMSE